MPEAKYLVMVSADNNNNKYYRMLPNDDGTWTAEYGRVGSVPATRKYSINTFQSKYNEKIRKGYIDQTDLVQDMIEEHEPQTESEYKEIENKAIAEIVNKLMRMAKETISKNYTISSNAVTIAMVEDAQRIINNLLHISDVEMFNRELQNLFTTIPRKMSKVKDYLAVSSGDFKKIIQREQDLLDVMRGQVITPSDKTEKEKIKENKTDNKDKKTVLETFGIVFEECNEEDIKEIKKALGSSVHNFSRAWRVTNLETQKRYDKFIKESKIKDTKLLFHGSRNENWWSIIKTGLKLRPTNAVITGKLFGIGTYFAPKAQKSIGYTSLMGSYWAGGRSSTGYMALMEVAYGKPFDVNSFSPEYYNLNYEKLQKYKKGANCLHAHAGANLGYTNLRNDEIVIYKEEQCTIKYLVEIKN